MKAATLLAVVLLLAGTVSSNPVKAKRPDWVPDWVPQLPEGWFPIDLPDGWFPEGGLPDGWFPELPEGWFPELPEGWFPDISDIEKPDWLPEIEWEQVKEKIQEVVEKIREKIQSIDWENLTVEQIREALRDVVEEWIERIREIIEGIQLPEVNINSPVPGKESSIQEFPSAAQIEFGTGPFWLQACGGAIITNFHIVSSARCFTGILSDVKNRRVRLGASDRYDSGIVQELATVVVHESFGNSENGFFDGDMALARTAIPIGFTDTIQSTQIVVSGFVVPPNLPVVLAAWGNTAQGSSRGPDNDLYSIELVAIDQASCADKWASLPLPGTNVEVGQNHFCAGRPETGGRNLDGKDIGSPIFSNNILVGVVSYGNYVGNQNYALVATSISSYTDWIVANAV